MGLPSGAEWLIILVIVVIMFGGGKLAGVGKSLGTAITEFKSALKGEDEKDTTNTPNPNNAAKPE